VVGVTRKLRGGPTCPAIFLGVVAGLMAGHLPGYAETQAVAALVGALCVAVLRLPLSSVTIATLLCAKAGLAVVPLIVVGVTVAYGTSEVLTAFVDARVGADRPRAGAATSRFQRRSASWLFS
jgi:chloride channel protein, CIC family